MKEALVAAKESNDFYKRLNSKNNLIVESMIRVERLIAGLKWENMDDVNEMLTR